jgi:hypothetical protein
VPSITDHPEIPDLRRWVEEFKTRGLTAESIAYSWIKRQIQPHQLCHNPGYRYRGIDNPSRFLRIELSHETMMYWMKTFFNQTTYHLMLLEEYLADNPP